MNLIYNTAKMINGYENTDKALKTITFRLGAEINCERIYLLIKDPISNVLTGRYGFNISDKELSRLSYSIGEGIIGKTFRTGLPSFIPDISTEPEFLRKLRGGIKEEDKGLSFICIPVKHRKKIVGIIGVEFKKENIPLTINELTTLMKMVSDIIGAAVNKYGKLKAENELLKTENIRLKAELETNYQIDNVVAVNKQMQKILKDVKKIAQTDVTVLLRGESGTGKEVLAKAIHFNSRRKNKPFIAINCAALPESLIEAELFGYEKGAFTGASSLKKGKFELANGGTIFLDEIGDMPFELQAKLLRVLQEKEITRLGGNKPIKVDVRIIAATNRNLEKMVSEGKFREDLYYRLSVVSIYIPPLRDRKDDIPALTEFILQKLSERHKRKFSIAPETFSLLMKCDWPGNVRQLENCLERAVIFSDSNTLKPENFPCYEGKPCPLSSIIPFGSRKTETGREVESAVLIQKRKPFEKPSPEEEKRLIEDALRKTGFCQAKAARLLGMTPRQINYRIKKYNIKIPKI
ncbi:Nif-specific regulatory protein [Desulfurobacterium atlanticum]|uniref:Nif-specific regulatory protein n=2 Tax=Desulfurobacterium atlanticum TaxID=240169 RepID=A0A238YRF6_9BACT|nr:Nif-specific regulatory protein [Desulfurobacterium atlanticum]